MNRQQNQRKSKTKTIGGYQLGKKIGSGTFATVKQAIHIKTNEKVAIKILRKKLIVDTRDKINLSRELRIIQKLRHPNIVQLLQILQTNNKIYLVMEHAEGGELYDLIVKDQKSRLDEELASLYFQQLLNTVQYLHTLGVTHRDLKPENILITKNNIIKLIDFGLSNLYQPKQQLATACGSPCYAAPEMLNQKSYDPLKADLWSCGIVLYTMLVGYLPYQHQNTNQLYKLVAYGQYDEPSHLSSEAKDFIKKLLVAAPQKRLTISQMRAHPFCRNRAQPIIKGLLPNQKIDIDIDIVQQMKDMGFSGFIKDIENNVLSESTATFYLLLFRKLREQKIDSSSYYVKIIKKISPFRSRSTTQKRQEQKNPQQLPFINKKIIQSHQALFKYERSPLLIEVQKRTTSIFKDRNSLRIKRVIK